MTEIVLATAAHAEALAPTLLQEHRDEVLASGGFGPREALLAALAVSYDPQALLIDGEVAALWGAAPLVTNPRVGVVWMLAGTLLLKNTRDFLRLCRPAVAKLLERYDVLTNAIDARFTRALRWALWLGFTVEAPAPFGAAGLPFCRITLGRLECASQ